MILFFDMDYAIEILTIKLEQFNDLRGECFSRGRREMYDYYNDKIIELEKAIQILSKSV